MTMIPLRGAALFGWPKKHMQRNKARLFVTWLCRTVLKEGQTELP
jgi:hypothetical protein